MGEFMYQMLKHNDYTNTVQGSTSNEQELQDQDQTSGKLNPLHGGLYYALNACGSSSV